MIEPYYAKSSKGRTIGFEPMNGGSIPSLAMPSILMVGSQFLKLVVKVRVLPRQQVLNLGG